MQGVEMSQILEGLATLTSPLINAHHADVSQPWSGLAEIMIEVRPNPGLGPVTLEVAVETRGVILAKEIADGGISQVRFGIETNLLPDGPAVLMFTAKQDRFIWESGLAFQVNSPSAVAEPSVSNEIDAHETPAGDVTNSLTIFRYPCACGEISLLKRGNDYVQCPRCAAKHTASASGIIEFFGKKTGQNAYFDSLYEAGLLRKKDELAKESAQSYEGSYSRAQEYLTLCGIDQTRPVTDLAILDAACGAGWVTAGLLRNPMVQRCRFHAYDISPHGLELLAKFAKAVQSTNVLEMSVQDANQMVFEDSTFDLVIGNSVLHHFDDVPSFLTKCRKILKAGGMAIFGEPFAIGYGLGVGALMAAQRQLGLQYPGIDAMYQDIKYRIQNPNRVENLVDKHLFFQASFLSMALSVGFSDVSFVSPAPREFYRDQFISELMAERGVSDPMLLARANDIYSALFEMFDAESYVGSIGAFIQVVLRA
jgi:ubiquinone/menaquinone biosynthesis C-methylase UbiE